MAFTGSSSRETDDIRRLSNRINELEEQLRYALGNIGGENIVAGSVGAEQLAPSAIQIDKLSDGLQKQITGPITTDRIRAGSITADKIKAGAVTAQKLAAGAVTADKITAAAVQAILAQITTAQIDWASINSLSAVMANIANARISTADIDFSHIKDLVADTAIITQGSGEKLYIKRLAVDAAQMVDLTVGQLTVKASDGQYYSLDVDIETGTVTANPVTVTQAEIDAGQTESGQHIIESDLTVSDLNAATATATEALINKLTAGRIDVDTLFARQAVIDAISTMEIAGEGTLSFFVTKQKELDGYVRVVAEGDVVYLEVGKAGDPARFRTDNRTMEVTNIKTERLGITQKMTRDEDWIFVAGKSGFGIKYVGEEVV